MTDGKKGVVYVRFGGAGRGRLGEVFEKETVSPPVVTNKEAQTNGAAQSVFDQAFDEGASATTMSETFTRKEVARLFDISDGRLAYWDKSGFISPSGYVGKRRCYTFADLISIRSAKALLENGVSLQKTRAMIARLGQLLPQSTAPLGQLRIVGDDSQVAVQVDGRQVEPLSGQLLIDFSVEALEEDVICALPDHQTQVPAKTAYEWYIEGCRLDEDEQTLDAAEYAYHQALSMEPTLVNAYTNLGNLRYRLGAREDARALYEKSLELDPHQSWSHYNLGYLDYEEGAYVSAKFHFEQAVLLDNTFADAYFNLAMTLIQLNEDGAATVYWKKYLELEPSGTWADIARRHLSGQ